MRIIEPHIHMISRTASDYERMARQGVVAVSEPAFWAGYDRTSAAAFHDYFTHLTGFEPARAARYGIQHYTWLCINAKEADNLPLAREVMALIPAFLDQPTVLGIGEIGLNKNTANEMKIFEEQVELALKYQQLILIHTPHLEDKLKGTRMMVDYLKGHGGVSPDRVLVDHAEEHTLGLIRAAGFWAGITVYPVTKTSPARAVDMIARFGGERLMVNSAADWGPSDPDTLHQTIAELRRRGHAEELIATVVYDNPCAFMGQSPRFACQPRAKG